MSTPGGTKEASQAGDNLLPSASSSLPAASPVSLHVASSAPSASTPSSAHSPRGGGKHPVQLAGIRTRPVITGETSGQHVHTSHTHTKPSLSKEADEAAKRKAFLLKKQRMLQSTLRQTLSQAIITNEETINTFHTEDPAFLQQQAAAAQASNSAANAAAGGSATAGTPPLTQQSSGSSKQRGSKFANAGSPDRAQTAGGGGSKRPSLTPDHQQQNATPTRRERSNTSSDAVAATPPASSALTLSRTSSTPDTPPVSAMKGARTLARAETMVGSRMRADTMTGTLSRADSMMKVNRSPGAMHRGIIISPRANQLRFTPDGKLIGSSGNPSPANPSTPASAVHKNSSAASTPSNSVSPLAAALARKVVRPHSRGASRPDEQPIGNAGHARSGSRELKVNIVSPAHSLIHVATTRFGWS